MRARTLSSGKLRIRCTKDAPEQNAYKWHTLKTERHKRVSLLYSLDLGFVCIIMGIFSLLPAAMPTAPAEIRRTILPTVSLALATISFFTWKLVLDRYARLRDGTCDEFRGNCEFNVAYWVVHSALCASSGARCWSKRTAADANRSSRAAADALWRPVGDYLSVAGLWCLVDAVVSTAWAPDAASLMDAWKLVIVGCSAGLGFVCKSPRYKVLVWQHCASCRGLLEVGDTKLYDCDLSPY
ncbi:hypothetical protein JL720_8410 [Aureococcus anophagefferens]|nr:hypothetical protein JL720_8410 [Aureococcus anophagefferens]